MSSSIPPEGRPLQAAHADSGRTPGVSSDELLPPIEPPSAKFILQLFVVPAVIVSAVVLVWFLIESLARRGDGDVDEMIRVIGSSSQARFQKAHDLANMLNVPERYPKLRTNHDAARQLGETLVQEVDAASDSDASVQMRIFLSTALGKFQVEDGLPALLKTAHSDPQRNIRRLAIQSIVMLARELSRLNPPQRLTGDELIDTLLALADDPDEEIHAEATFLLGVAATAPEADSRLTEKLVELTEDPYTDARFNAATALAKLGDPRAAQAVAEMLEADSLAASLSGLKGTTTEGEDVALKSRQTEKRNTIVHGALAAIETLSANKDLASEARATLEKALVDFIAAAPRVQEPAPLPDALIEAAKRALADLQAAR